MSKRLIVAGAAALLGSAVQAQGAIVLNEVMANPAAVSDTAGEWVELHNTGGTPVDLTNWVLADAAGSFTLPSLTILGHGFALLGRNPDPAVNGGVALDLAYGGAISLNNSNESLSLSDATATIVDQMTYVTAVAGISTERIDPLGGGLDPTNWTAATTQWAVGSDLGTPGAVNAATVPEPSALGLVGGGLLLAACAATLRRR